LRTSDPPSASGSSRTVSDPRTLASHPELVAHRSFPFFKTVGESPKGWLERLLSLFADVRAGEGVGVLLLTLNVFLLLGLYYLLRSARQALILTEGAPFGWTGAQLAAYSAAGMALVLLGVVPAFGWLASRVPRLRLISITTVFFALNLAAFYVAGRSGARLAALFYIWLGVFNVFVVAQFWSFANDLYSEGQGRRLFPFVGVGASLGAWVGASSVTPLVRRLAFTPYTLMLLAGGVLLVALVITWIVNQRETSRADAEAQRVNEAPLGKEGGFALVWQDPYLRWIAVLTILLNVVNTVGGFLLNQLVENGSLALGGLEERQRFVTIFFSTFDARVSLLGLLLQLFATSRVIRHWGVRGSLFILPVIALVNYSIIAVVPVLAVIRLGKILENSTDYSIQNTLRHALFLPTTREAKYKAKSVIDTFCTRFGDVLQAVVVFGGTALGLGVWGFAWLNVGLTAAWLAVAFQIAREHRKKTL
jgi:ATP:ADP antiporter, AAA family